MKKLSFFLSIMFLSAAVFAQAKEVPQNVMAAFSTKYPGVEVKKWKTGTDGYTAEFSSEKKTCTAVFSNKGEWLRTENKVRWTWNLPPQVNKALKTGKYAAWYVEKIKFVETPSGKNYVLRVNNKALLPAQEINVFRETRLLYYNEDGDLLSSDKI